MAKNTGVNEGMIWGLILVALGVIFLLQNFFDVEIFKHIWQFWPAALIIWGVAIIANRDKR